MEHELIKSESNELIIDFKPFDQAILNLVKEELWQDSATQVAGFKVTHPQVGVAHFVLKTKGKNAKDVWNSAVKRAQSRVEELGKEFSKL